MDFTIKEYIRLGGIKYIEPYNLFNKYDFEKIANKNQVWFEGDFEVINISLEQQIIFEIIFDCVDGKYHADYLRTGIELLDKDYEYIKKTNLFFAEQFKKSAYINYVKIVDELYDKDEKILFLNNGVNLHFLKSHIVDDYLIMKVDPNGAQYRQIIKKIFL